MAERKAVCVWYAFNARSAATLAAATAAAAIRGAGDRSKEEARALCANGDRRQGEPVLCSRSRPLFFLWWRRAAADRARKRDASWGKRHAALRNH